MNTTGSSNIAVLDSKIVASLCTGKICVDVTPSSYIGDGALNVLGANVQITNPFGVIVKPFGSNYEIAPDLSGGMDAAICFNIPTQAGTYQYGKYKVEVQLFDDAGNWTITKYVSICEPDKNNKTKNYGSLSAQLKSSCKDGKVFVIVDNVPNYNGKTVESQTNDLTLEYPTGSGLPALDTSLGSFSVQLYEGVYKVSGDICATYNFGDNVYVDVKYVIKKRKEIRCLIDECCVFTALSDINLRLKDACTSEEKERFTWITLDALRLLKTIQLAGDCGEDASDDILEIEKLLGCSCACNCAEGTPIINTSPAKDFNITGCNVTKETVGTTDNYTIENFGYAVTVEPNGGVITVDSGTLSDCTITYKLTFNVATLYNQIKALATPDADAWAEIINSTLTDIDPACLGVSQSTWNSWTLKQRIEAIVNAFCEQTGCEAELTGATITQDGANVLLSWTNSPEVFCIDIYLDGVFKATVCPGLSNPAIDEYLFEDVANYEEHKYTLIPKCSNGELGTPITGTFQYAACPDIAPPELTETNLNGVECPFDLTSLQPAELPAGIDYEWHTQNNTLGSSLVADPTSVSSGVYFVFAKDTDGCYSISVKVTVLCEVETSCTAPQALEVRKWSGGMVGPILPKVLVLFKSAAFPPPGNSYTVKRRLASDPDIDGSYTTVGTPTWSSFFNRWIIFDGNIDNNTLYVWRAQSNCGGSPATTPYIDFNFANMVCSVVDTTPDIDSVEYSMITTGSNEIDKYEVQIYDETGTILIHTDTYTPAFADPITGVFNYLDSNTTYKIVVTAYIGTYKKTSCATTTFTTLAP